MEERSGEMSMATSFLRHRDLSMMEAGLARTSVEEIAPRAPATAKGDPKIGNLAAAGT